MPSHSNNHTAVPSLSAAAPMPQNIREEEDMMRQAIAASLQIGVEQVDPEHVQRNLGYSRSTGSASTGAGRRGPRSSRLPLNTGVFC